MPEKLELSLESTSDGLQHMVTLKEIDAAFSPYKNANGMIPFCGSPPCITQNDALFTAYAIMAMEDATGLPVGVVHPELISAYEKHLDQDGLTHRKPGDIELESNDNLIGWGVAAFYLNQPEWTVRILKFARANAWVWPGEGTVPQRWLGRHRATEAHLQLAAGEQPDFVTQFFWCIAVILGCFAKTYDADAFSLSYCMVRLAHANAKVPMAMYLVGWGWKSVQDFRKMTMSRNLFENYGWGNSPHAKYIV